MQKNEALEIFSQHFNEIVELTKIFQSCRETIKHFSVDEMANLPDDFLKSNKLSPQIKHGFIGLKVTLASNILTLLLGHPPTIRELAEVADESYFKIYRFIKATDICLPYVIRKKNSSEICELQRVASKRCICKIQHKSDKPEEIQRPQKGVVKAFVWRGPGIRNTVDSGRPNIFPVFASSRLIDTFQLTGDEKDEFLTYPVSPSYVAAMKRFIVEQLGFLLELLDTDFMKACVKILSNSISVMWERAVKLAKEEKLMSNEEFEKLPLEEWLLSIQTEEFKRKLHEFIREVEEMPNAALAKWIILAFVKGLSFEGLVSKPSNGHKVQLRCTKCLCLSPISAPSEIVTCVFCGTKYKK